MRRVAAVMGIGLGTLLALLGVLFLVGADGEVRRLVVAAIGLVGGAALVGVGIRLWKVAEALSPARLRVEILEAAKREDGEISAPELEAALGRRFAPAEPVLERLVSEGRCRRQQRSGGLYYVFPELQPRLAVRRCEYCGAELPLADELSSCPSCGGAVQTGVVQRSFSGGEGLFSMDES